MMQNLRRSPDTALVRNGLQNYFVVKLKAKGRHEVQARKLCKWTRVLYWTKARAPSEPEQNRPSFKLKLQPASLHL